MTVDELIQSIADNIEPAGVPPLVSALWYDARGDWDRAHRIAQDVDTRDGARVHAYLHRREGDLGNAGYWYRRAGVPDGVSVGSLQDEWTMLAQRLLEG